MLVSEERASWDCYPDRPGLNLCALQRRGVRPPAAVRRGVCVISQRRRRPGRRVSPAGCRPSPTSSARPASSGAAVGFAGAGASEHVRCEAGPYPWAYVHTRALDRRPDRRPGRSPALHRFGHRGPAALHRGGPSGRPGSGDPRRFSVHPRRASGDVPQASLDDAPVRRLRLGDGVQRALQVPARAWLHRAVDGLRPADPAGPGLRRPALPRRGRPDRGLDRHARRHAHRLRGDPARRDLHVDDDQRAGDGAAGAVLAGRRGAGLPAGRAAGNDPERRAQGVHRARELHLPARGHDAADDRSLRILQGVRPEVEHHLDLGVSLP